MGKHFAVSPGERWSPLGTAPGWALFRERGMCCLSVDRITRVECLCVPPKADPHKAAVIVGYVSLDIPGRYRNTGRRWLRRWQAVTVWWRIIDAVTIDLNHFVFPPAPQNDVILFLLVTWGWWWSGSAWRQALCASRLLHFCFFLFWMTWIRSCYSS